MQNKINFTTYNNNWTEDNMIVLLDCASSQWLLSYIEIEYWLFKKKKCPQWKTPT